MARQLLRDASETTRRIMDGELDNELDFIQQAVSARRKMMFKVNAQVRITGANDVSLDGQVGVVMKVNPKRITVGFGQKLEWGGYEKEYNIPPSMLELV